jgi:hypothetical protein
MAQGIDHKTTLMRDGGPPLVLVGPPRDVRGELRVQNPTERRIVVWQPLLKVASAPRAKSASAKAASAKAAEQASPLPDSAIALRRVVVRAGQTRPVPVALSLDPRTPPGTYHAELDLAGEQRAVVMHITEEVAIGIAPPDVVLLNHPGEKVHRQVVFTNDGNVPLAIKSLGLVVLDEDLAHCRALRGALTDVGDTMKSLDDFAVALGRRYHAIYETLALRIKNEETSLAPGETRAIELTITLPEKMDRRSRYTGYAAVSTATLTFTIVPD